VTATKEEIGLRVDALAQAHSGDEFVGAAERLAAELDEDDCAVAELPEEREAVRALEAASR
jgi:hypothetical protein